MRSKGGCVLRLGVATTLLVGSAHAQREEGPAVPQSTVYAYTSPVECPQRSEFVSRVNARQSAHAASEVDDALNELLSRVVVESLGTRGSLHFRDARLAPRQVTANTCDEVVTGLALIAGVALNGPASLPDVVMPESAERAAPADAGRSPGSGAEVNSSDRETALEGAVNGAVPASRSGANEPPSAVPTAASQRTAPVGESVVSASNAAGSERRGPTEAASAKRVTRALEPVVVSREGENTSAELDAAEPVAAEPVAVGLSQGSSLAVGLGAAAGLWTAFGKPELRADAFFELGDRDQTWAARVSGFGAWNEASALSWSATWATYGARLEGCPMVGGQGWHLAVCGVAELGSVGVRSDSSVGDHVDDTRLLWADGGVGLRVGTPSVWKVNVEAQLDAVVPFTRYGLTFEEPTVALAHVPSIAVTLRLGFRWRPGLE